MPGDQLRRKPLPWAVALLAVLVASSMVGLGALAAWQAASQNNGSSLTSGTVNHKNTVSATCTSVTPLPSLGCDAVWVAVSGVYPGSAQPLATGTVKVSNSGSLPSTFGLMSVASGGAAAAPAGALCADLVLNIYDLNVPAVALYTAPMSQQVNILTLNNNAATPAATWTAGGPTPGGTGATGNTFTFKVTAGIAFATNSADAGGTCTANFRFTQANT